MYIHVFYIVLIFFKSLHVINSCNYSYNYTIDPPNIPCSLSISMWSLRLLYMHSNYKRVQKDEV